MEVVVLIPGITGSSLELNAQEIWPPNFDEVRSHYKRISLLLDDRVKAKEIIKWVILPCAEIYSPIVKDLQDICQQSDSQFVQFPYDWRRDIVDTAAQLGNLLEQFASDKNVTKITLVAHSMGGLIARTLLESPPMMRQRSKWQKKIKQLLCICTPHRGSPLSLAKCMGLEGDSTISSSDTKILCDSKYPTAYQLLPPESWSFVWDDSDPQRLRPIDIYSDGAQLLLNTRNLAVAQATYPRHDLDRRPNNVEYTFIFGTQHETRQSYLVNGLSVEVRNDRLGDGIVPTSSAGYIGNKPGIATWSTPGDHVGILAVQPFREFLFGYFGMSPQFRRQVGRPDSTVVLSLNKRIYAPGEPIGVLVIPDNDISALDATIQTEAYDVGRAQLMRKAVKVVGFRGGPTKLIQIEIAAPTKPGGYRLIMAGSHKTIEGTHGWFVVSDTARRATRIQRTRTRSRPRRLAKKRASRR